MVNSKLVNDVAKYMENLSLTKDSAHDWWHLYRVWNNAKKIAVNENNPDMTVVELAALLHDISDWKENDGDSLVGANLARDVLKKFGADEKIIDHVVEIVENASKNPANGNLEPKTLEGKIVKDADRLDAIGAIAIARTFTYGGLKKIPIHDPVVKPDPAEYGKRLSETSINYFYEKLLLLKEKMNTSTGKEIARERHEFMEGFLKQFHNEWDGLN